MQTRDASTRLSVPQRVLLCLDFLLVIGSAWLGAVVHDAFAGPGRFHEWTLQGLLRSVALLGGPPAAVVALAIVAALRLGRRGGRRAATLVLASPLALAMVAVALLRA